MKAIAAVDIMDGKVVRLLRGNPKESTVYGDDPVAMAKRWAKEGAHMLHIVDLDATLGLGSNLNVIREIALAVDVPVQIAGGLRNAEIIDNTAACANSLVIGTLAFKDKPVLREAYAKYGADRLVISVDHRDGIIVVNGWQSSTGIKLLNGVEEFMQMGFTNFLLTNVSCDGTLEGPDIKGLRAVVATGAKTIASGGISGIEDVKLVKECGASGVMLGKALYENRITIKEALTEC